MAIKSCLDCDCWDSDREGCTMASVDRSYACPLVEDERSSFEKAAALILLDERKNQ